MGLDILDDKEMEQDEEDREVEQLLNKGKEAEVNKRYIQCQTG